MLKALLFRLSICLLAVGVTSLSYAEEKHGDASASEKDVISAPQLLALLNAPSAPGSELYADFCAACHQEKGEGVGEDFPALAKNTFVTGDREELIYLLLEGRSGMPTFIEDLTSEEMVEVINFIRTSWGNKAPKVTLEEVDELRDEIEEEDDGYTREG